MKLIFAVLAAAVLLPVRAPAAPAPDPGPAPGADEIIQMALARARRDETNAVADFVFKKMTSTEDLDEAGRVKERKQKVYEISCRGGFAHGRLLEVNGHAPSAGDLKEQSQNELILRTLLGRSKANGDVRESFLTPELTGRFDFRLIGQTNVAGRAAYEIAFAPKTPEPPQHRLVDRLLDHVSGTVWIDAREFEVARVEVVLRSEVNLLGGVIGSLKKLDYTLERTRVADGLWLSTLSRGDFQGRRLLGSLHIKTQSESVQFRPG